MRACLGLAAPVTLVGEDLDPPDLTRRAGHAMIYLVVIPVVAGFTAGFDFVITPVMALVLWVSLAALFRSRGMLAGPGWVAGRRVCSLPLTWRWQVVRAGEIRDVHLSRTLDLTTDAPGEQRAVILRTPSSSLRVGADRWPEVRELLRPHVSAEVAQMLTAPRTTRRRTTQRP